MGLRSIPRVGPAQGQASEDRESSVKLEVRIDGIEGQTVTLFFGLFSAVHGLGLASQALFRSSRDYPDHSKPYLIDFVLRRLRLQLLDQRRVKRRRFVFHGQCRLRPRQPSSQEVCTVLLPPPRVRYLPRVRLGYLGHDVDAGICPLPRLE